MALRSVLKVPVIEVVDNAIDEAQAGYATEVSVVLEEDGACCVTDNGRGIPINAL